MIRLRGWVTVRRNGLICAAGSNIVTITGMNLFAAIIAGEAVDAPGWLAMGTSGAPSTEALEDLVGTELDRAAAVTSRTANAVSYAATLGGGLADPATVREFGVFNDDTAGTMICRFVSQAIAMDVGETVDVTWTISIGGTQ